VNRTALADGASPGAGAPSDSHQLPPIAASPEPLTPVAPIPPIAPVAPIPPAPAPVTTSEYDDPDEPSDGPGRPGLLAGGIVMEVIGTGLAVLDGIAINNTAHGFDCSGTGFVGVGSPLGCTLAITGETFLTLIAAGVTAGGIAMTVIGSQPKRERHHRRRPAQGSFEIRPSVGGLFINGAF
jgi:hypothetical protein